MPKRILTSLISLLISIPVFSQLVAGPKVGYSEMREVLLWVQTEKATAVKFNYWEKDLAGQRFSTETVRSEKHNNFIVKLIADEVLPGKKYEYELILNGAKQKFSYPLEFQTQTLWQYRSDPPAFKFAVGSCVYTNEARFDRPGEGYGKSFKIFDQIYTHKPNFMVWGGDNIYLRAADWYTNTGIYHRYKEFKRQPELQKLWANTHHYAIWDDHDYGSNDADRSFAKKQTTLQAFKDNWGNPNYIFEDEAITGTFAWEDVQFFLMDNRWFRAPNYLKDSTKAYFGEKQLDWLIDALAASTAPFKFVITGGQVVNPARVFENMSTYPVEREEMFDKIEQNNISGVIFISGDRHHSCLRKMDRKGTYPIYDITLSSLTSGIHNPRDSELTSDIVPKTLVGDLQNFGILEVSGPLTDRMLKINVIDSEGKPRWEYKIRANDLRRGKE